MTKNNAQLLEGSDGSVMEIAPQTEICDATCLQYLTTATF